MPYLLAVLAILGLELLVAALIWIWWRTLKIQQEQFHTKTEDTYAELAKIVEDTAKESQEALTSALAKADSLEKEAATQSQAMAKHAQGMIEKQSEWQDLTNKKLWLAYEDAMNQETKAASAQMTTLLTEKAMGVSDQVAQDLQQTQAAFRRNLETQLQKAEAEIEAYKQSEIERIHTAAQSITSEVVMDTIGRELSPTDQHQLVKTQLQKALISLKS